MATLTPDHLLHSDGNIKSFGYLVTYTDPFSVYPTIAESLRSRLPLRNLNWNSTSRPFRSIPSLHVELIRDAASTKPLKEVEGDWAIRSNEAKEEDARQARRHQIPGLRQSPYLKIFFLKCDDVETYKATSRKDVREWINGHMPESQKSSLAGKRDNHDAFEWLIVQVVDKPVDRSGTPEATNDNKKEAASKRFSSLSRMSSRTSSSSVIEKVRSDFNGTSKNAVDRVVQITPEGDKLGFDDLVVKMKALILASFDLRVAQYEDDIREKEIQRTLPGWNFNTFFLLKEGLAKGFEAVGLLKDALSGYHELATGLNAIIEDQNAEHQAERAAAPFKEHTDELQHAYTNALSSLNESPEASAKDISNLGNTILDTSRKDFRNLILANNISVFDFQCYVFAREAALLLRLANSDNDKSKITNGHRKAESLASTGLGKPTDEEPENLLVLAEICQLTFEFIALGARRMRRDIETSIQQLNDSPTGKTFAASRLLQDNVVDNLISSWTNSICESILEATSSRTLSTQLRPLLGQLLPGRKFEIAAPQSVSVVSRRHERLPDRTSSLTGASKPKTPVQESFSSVSTPDGLRLLPPGTSHPGAQELAAQRGSLLVLSRRTLAATAHKIKGWQGGLAAASSQVKSLEMENVDLDEASNDDEDAKDSHHGTGEPTAQGIQNETLNLALRSDYEFYKAFEELTAMALAHFVVGTRTNAAEGMTADLAVVRFNLKDYKSAVSYFDQLASFYGKTNWLSLECAMLRMHAECLQQLGRTELFIQITLKAIALQTRELEMSGHLDSSLSEIITASSSLLQPLAVSLSDHFHSVTLDPYLRHYSDHDGFQMVLHLRSLLPESIQADSIRIKIVQAEKERGGEHWLSVAGPQEITPGDCKFLLGTKEMHPGWYRLSGVNIHAKNLVFVYDTLAKTSDSFFSDGRDSGSPLISDAVEERLLIWARSQHLNVQVGPSESIDLRKPRSVRVEVSSGWNQIQSGRLSIKAASAGLRIDTAEGKTQASPDSNGEPPPSISAKKYQPGTIEFGSLSPNKVLIIQIPYSLENDQSEIAVKVQCDYKTANGDFMYASDFKINANLPVSVNVQDIFKADALFPKFTIGTATSIPHRLFSCRIDGNANYEALSPALLLQPIDIFARQPYSFISKIREKQPSDDQGPQISKTFKRLLHLQIEYCCLEDEVYGVFENSLLAELEKLSLQDLLRPLKGTLRSGLQSRYTANDIETICLLGELSKGDFEEYDWKPLLYGLSIKERQALEEALRLWHKDFSPLVLTRESVYGARRQHLTVPFDLPSTGWVHTARLYPDDRTVVPNIGASGIAVDQTLPVRLEIYHTKRWDVSETDSKTETQDFIYEVHASQDTWLIGGQRRARFSAKDGGKHTFSLLLVPQTAGRLLYPSIDVTPISRPHKDQDAIGEDSSFSSETDYLSQGETILVLPNLASTTVSLDPGHGAWLVESRSRGR